MDFNCCRAFLIIGLLVATTPVYADNDKNGRITITEARVAFLKAETQDKSTANETLVIEGHNLCDIRRNRKQVVTLGARQSIDSLKIKTCVKNSDSEKNLDRLEAIIPDNLSSATYLLTLNNNVKVFNKDDDDDDRDDDGGRSNGRFIALFDFTYNSPLQLDLQAEIVARKKGDDELRTLVSGEASDRKAADDAEAAARRSADEALAGDLAAEAAARSFSDVILQANIDAEAKTRRVADEAETEARIAADLAETAAREAAVAQESAERLAADLEEALARIAADKSHTADIASNALNIDRVDRRVDKLEVSVNELSARVDAISLSVENLETNVQGLGGQIQANESALTDLSLQVGNLGSGLLTLTTEQAALRDELNALVEKHAADISTINSKLVDTNNTISALNAEVKDFAEQLRLQLTRIDQNTGQIERQGIQLNTTTLLANTNLLAINTLESKTASLQKQLDGQSEILSGIVAQLDVQDNRVSLLETYREIYEFKFSNTPADDIEQGALADFFRSIQINSSNYIFFEVDRATSASGAWCSTQAVWYINEYLSGYDTGLGIARSGTWQKWYRSIGGAWQATTLGHTNSFGGSCDGITGSWCSEWGIGGKFLGVMPGRTSTQELYAAGFGPGTLQIRIASTRFDACGF